MFVREIRRPLFRDMGPVNRTVIPFDYTFLTLRLRPQALPLPPIPQQRRPIARPAPHPRLEN
jgi:hypothetical protein